MVNYLLRVIEKTQGERNEKRKSKKIPQEISLSKFIPPLLSFFFLNSSINSDTLYLYVKQVIIQSSDFASQIITG